MAQKVFACDKIPIKALPKRVSSNLEKEHEANKAILVSALHLLWSLNILANLA